MNVLSVKSLVHNSLTQGCFQNGFSVCQLTVYFGNNWHHSVYSQQQNDVCVSVGVLLFRFPAFGHGGNSLSLYRVAARVGVFKLTADDLTDENKLTLCSKVLDDINEGLTLDAQVFF